MNHSQSFCHVTKQRWLVYTFFQFEEKNHRDKNLKPFTMYYKGFAPITLCKIFLSEFNCNYDIILSIDCLLDIISIILLFAGSSAVQGEQSEGQHSH